MSRPYVRCTRTQLGQRTERTALLLWLLCEPLIRNCRIESGAQTLTDTRLLSRESRNDHPCGTDAPVVHTDGKCLIVMAEVRRWVTGRRERKGGRKGAQNSRRLTRVHKTRKRVAHAHALDNKELQKRAKNYSSINKFHQHAAQVQRRSNVVELRTAAKTTAST